MFICAHVMLSATCLRVNCAAFLEHQNDMNDPEVDRERKLLPTYAAHAIYISMILPMHKSGTKASQFWMLCAVCCGHFPKTGHFIAGKSQ